MHFITTVTQHRGRWFTTDSVCRRLLEAFEFYRAIFDLACYGYVLMPDHLHVLLLQVNEDCPVSACLRDFKHLSSGEILKIYSPDCGGWREGYDDVHVPGHDAIRTKLRYLHRNPTRKGIVDTPEAYLWSSAGFYFENKESIVTVTYNPS